MALLAGLAVLAIGWVNRPPSINPRLIGQRPVRANDLPASWQGISDADMRIKLDELVADRLGERENWDRGSFTQDDCRQIRLAAKYLGDEQLAVRSLCWLAKKLESDRQEELAVDYLAIAIAEAEQAGLKDELKQCYFQQGRCFSRIGLYEWSLESYTKARDLARELGDPDKESYYLLQMANINYHRLLRYEEAMPLYDLLPEIAAQGVEPQSMIPKYNLWALSLQSYGRYHESLDAFQLALEAAEDAGNPDKILFTLKLLAINNLELNRIAESEELLKRAIALVPELERSNDIFDPHLQLASIYVNTDREDEAEALLLDTLDEIGIVETTADGEEREASILYQMRSERIKTLAALGGLKLLQDNPEKALEYFLQADKLNEGREFVLPTENMATNLAQVYIELGRFEDAQAQLAEAEVCGTFG